MQFIALSRTTTVMTCLALPLLLIVEAVALDMPCAWAQHEEHGGAASPAPKPGSSATIRLFQSDMTSMAGMMAGDDHVDSAVSTWGFMAIGIARLVYNRQGGASGDEALESTNWNMLMVHRPLGKGRFTAMLMNSLEPATVPNRGSPELFQTGESFEGEPLVDRQHPHDFFMHLSATYRRGVSQDAAVWVHVAPVGEPALGPTAYMHRASSGDNPTAPLGHHWQDATHITWNVITAGGGYRALAIETSVFHGEEPDEDRWGIDGGQLDSASGRLKLGAGHPWSAQVSHAYIHEPEALEEGDTHRTTASVGYGAAGNGPLALTLLWGRNREDHGVSDAFLAEGVWQMTRNDQVFTRFELVEKDEDLLATKQLPENDAGDAHLADISAFTLGYCRDLRLGSEIVLGLAGDVTVYGMPEALEPVYGDFPVSTHLFLRVRWGDAAQHKSHSEEIHDKESPGKEEGRHGDSGHEDH